MNLFSLIRHISCIIALCVISSCADTQSNESAAQQPDDTSSITAEDRKNVMEAASADAARVVEAYDDISQREQAMLQIHANACRLRRAGYPGLAEVYIRTARNNISRSIPETPTDNASPTGNTPAPDQSVR